MEQQAALSRLEPVLGKILNSKLEFKWDPDSGNMVSPDWKATVEVLQPGGGHLCYALFYEVFDGRLTGLLAYLPGTRPGTKPDEC